MYLFPVITRHRVQLTTFGIEVGHSIHSAVASRSGAGTSVSPWSHSQWPGLCLPRLGNGGKEEAMGQHFCPFHIRYGAEARTAGLGASSTTSHGLRRPQCHTLQWYNASLTDRKKDSPKNRFPCGRLTSMSPTSCSLSSSTTFSFNITTPSTCP